MGEKSTSFVQEAARLQQVIQTLRMVPTWSNEGFAAVGEQMNGVAEVFATGASRAISVRERMEATEKLGVQPMRADLESVARETGVALSTMAALAAHKDAFIQQLEETIQWGMALEQEVVVPSVVDQIRAAGSERVERQTMGAMIDNLLQQLRPLLHETRLHCQTASDTTSNLLRLIRADLEISRHRAEMFQNKASLTVQELERSVDQVDLICQGIIERSGQVNQIFFEMIQLMQYDDIAAQRIQHSLEALAQAQERLAVGGKLRQDARRWVVLALRIVIDQLNHTSDELLVAAGTIRDHLDTVARLCQQQADDVASARHACRFFHQNLEEIAYHLRAMLDIGLFADSRPGYVLQELSVVESSLFQTRRSFDMLVMTAERLTKLARTLKTDNSPRLVALNAMVERLADRTQEDGRQRHNDVLQSIDRLHQISIDYSDTVTPKIMRTNSMLRRLPLSARQMDTANTDQTHALNDTMADALFTAVQIRLLVADFGFHERIRDTILQIVGELEQVQQQVGRNMGGDYMTGDPYTLAAEFEDLARLYTMESERRVHGNALGCEDTDSEASGSEENDIELF